MKDHRERVARLQLIEHMSAGHSWQTAVGPEPVEGVSLHRLSPAQTIARDEEKAERAFLDDRHGHPYKLTEPVRVWID